MNEMLMQNAASLRRAGRLVEAAQVYSDVLRSDPKNFEALHGLGIIRYQGGQIGEAERLIGEAIKIKPNAADAIYNRACLLQKMNRVDEAMAGFGQAIAIKPDYVEALTNRGTLFMNLKRYEAALADFDKVAALRPNFPQVWNNRAGALVQLGRSGEALASADKAVAMQPQYPDAWLNRGGALIGERRFSDAMQSFERAIALNPNNANSWSGKGYALAELGRYPEAVKSYTQALQLAPQDIETLFRRAAVHFHARHFPEAAGDLRRLLVTDPNYPRARGMLLFADLCVCSWRGFAEERGRALADLRAGVPSLAPFETIVLSDSEEDAGIAARNFVTAQNIRSEPLWRGGTRAHGKIRVAYVSANFHDHAVARLMAGVWEGHDKSRFETIAVSFGPDDGSTLRARVAASFDRFADVRTLTDRDAAGMLHALEADIAVDLMGYTEGLRPGILALRPAPVQVNYLGFPGTMGAPHIDYILADRIVIPEEARAHYTEQVAYLPSCYLPNDAKRAIAAHRPTRAEAGLPEEGFVFASFNHSYKLTPAVFALWMRILEQVPDSVLWLGQCNEIAARNLKLEAGMRRIDPARIVLASYVRGQDEHLARLPLAGLVLDTLPYTSHATACDALWACVPVLTCIGKAFAGRVAASALTAVGLPELIAATPAEYETLAVKLAADPAALAALKEKIARNRATQPLFDTAQFTRHLEAAFATMHERAQRGQAPAGFAVAP
jgi:protein O-GlcNAc transferase